MSVAERVVEPLDSKLVTRYLTKDQDAMTEVILYFENFICKMSRIYYAKGLAYEDLKQEGYLALDRAVKSFNPECLNHYDNFVPFVYMCIRRHYCNVVKVSLRKKHTHFNEAYSLESNLSVQDKSVSARTLLSSLEDHHSPDPLTRVVEVDSFWRRIEYLKSRMTPLEFSVIWLRTHSLTISEIAEHMGIPFKRVDNALQRSKRKAERLSLEYDREIGIAPAVKEAT